MPRNDTQAQVVVIVAGRYGRSGLARRVHANFLPAEARACIFSTVNPLPNLAPSWDVAPTSDCAVVRRHPETGAWQPLDLLKRVCSLLDEGAPDDRVDGQSSENEPLQGMKPNAMS